MSFGSAHDSERMESARTCKATEEEGIIYTLNNVIEADISHAYYRSAFIQGFISKALYLDILKNCSKNERLHASQI